MNQAAKQHLTTAKEYIAQGDGFYWMAGEEIVAAQEADSTLSNGEIGKWFGKGEKWVRTLVQHVTTSSPETSIDWGRGSHATTAELREGAAKLAASDPMIVNEMLNAMGEEQREMVMQSIAQQPAFVEAVKADPALRDDLYVDMYGTETEKRDRKDERERKDISDNAHHGWRPIIDAFGDANRYLTHALDGFVKLSLYRGVYTEEDMLGLAKSRAEMIGRSIREIELAWGESPITDKIEELRAEQA